MKTQLLMLLTLAAALVVGNPPAAQACDAFGGGYGWLYNSLEYRVPYFAAHPPVYYSHPVPRTYGYSPFAYPPHVMTPEIVGEPQPLEIINPYVPSSQQTPVEPQSDRSAAREAQPEPLLVVNPYAMPTASMARAGQ